MGVFIGVATERVWMPSADAIGKWVRLLYSQGWMASAAHVQNGDDWVELTPDDILVGGRLEGLVEAAPTGEICVLWDYDQPFDTNTTMLYDGGAPVDLSLHSPAAMIRWSDDPIALGVGPNMVSPSCTGCGREFEEPFERVSSVPARCPTCESSPDFAQIEDAHKCRIRRFGIQIEVEKLDLPAQSYHFHPRLHTMTEEVLGRPFDYHAVEPWWVEAS